MCGIFGFAGNTPANIDKLKILGLYNQSRGEDSCGYAVPSHLDHGVDTAKEWASFLTKRNIELDPMYNSFIGHTRKKTHGLATLANAHPFRVGVDLGTKKKKSTEEWLKGAHNGVIKNYIALAKKMDVNIAGVEVDSHAFLRCLATKCFGSKADYGKALFSEYEGAGAFAWMLSTCPEKVFLFRGKSRADSYAKAITDERPLYIYKTEEGIYFSSMWEALYAIGGDAQDVMELPANIVFAIENNELVEIAKTEREEKGFQTAPYVSTHSSVSSSYPARNTGTSVPSNIILTKDIKDFAKAKETYINICNDTLPKRVKVKGGVIFEKGRFWRNGHLCDKPEGKVLHNTSTADLIVGEKVGKEILGKMVNGSYYTTAYFVKGYMFTSAPLYPEAKDLYKDVNVMFPACDHTLGPKDQIFYQYGKVADGVFRVPGGAKTLYIKNGRLEAIIDYVTKQITHTSVIALDDGLGKQTALPISTGTLTDIKPISLKASDLENIPKEMNSSFLASLKDVFEDTLPEWVNKLEELYVDPISMSFWTRVEFFKISVWIEILKFSIINEDSFDGKFVATLPPSELGELVTGPAKGHFTVSSIEIDCKAMGIRTLRTHEFMSYVAGAISLGEQHYKTALLRIYSLALDTARVFGFKDVIIETTYTAAAKTNLADLEVSVARFRNAERRENGTSTRTFGHGGAANEASDGERNKSSLVLLKSSLAVSMERLLQEAYAGNSKDIFDSSTDFFDFRTCEIWRVVAMAKKAELDIRYVKTGVLIWQTPTRASKFETPELKFQAYVTQNPLSAAEFTRHLEEMNRRFAESLSVDSKLAFEKISHEHYDMVLGEVLSMHEVIKNPLKLDRLKKAALGKVFPDNAMIGAEELEEDPVEDAVFEEAEEMSNRMYETIMEINNAAEEVILEASPYFDVLDSESEELYKALGSIRKITSELITIEDEDKTVEIFNGPTLQKPPVLMATVPSLMNTVYVNPPGLKMPANALLALTNALHYNADAQANDFPTHDGRIFRSNADNTAVVEVGHWGMDISRTAYNAIRIKFRPVIDRDPDSMDVTEYIPLPEFLREEEKNEEASISIEEWMPDYITDITFMHK